MEDESFASRTDRSTAWGKLPSTHGMAGPHSLLGSFGKEKNLSTMSRIKPRFLDCLALSLVIILTELSRIDWRVIMKGETAARRKWGKGEGSICETSLCDLRVVKTHDATLLEVSQGYTFELQNTGWLKTVTFNFRILRD
jgi:hypothetical protein